VLTRHSREVLGEFGFAGDEIDRLREVKAVYEASTGSE
jgi:hypothetical protein